MNTKDKNNQPGFFEKISQGIEAMIRSPYLPDPDHKRRAEIVHALSSIVLVTALATISITPFVFINILYGLIATGSIVLAMILVQLIIRKGKIRQASLIFVYFVWVIDTAIILLSGGYISQYLPSYIAITVMGGLILGGYSAYHFSGLSITTFLLFFFLESQGLMPPPLIGFTPVASILIFAANLLLSATVLTMVLKGYEDNFTSLIKKEKSLSKTNLELNQEILTRKKTEELLRQSEDRFRSALMESPYPTMLHDEDGEIISINPAWEQISGYSASELGNFNNWIERAFRENSGKLRQDLERVLGRDREKIEGSYLVYDKQGNQKKWYFRWALLPELPNGKQLILTIAMDLTNLMQVETALRESEEHLSKISLATNDGIWDWDLQTDVVIFDPRYYTLAGYQVNEFPHHLEEFRKRVHPDDVEHVFKAAEDHLEGKSDIFSVEFRFLRKDNSWIWILGRGKITEQDANGNPLRFVGTHTDISDRKKAEEELHQYRLQLEEIVEDRTKKLEERIKEVEQLNSALTNILDDYQTANLKLTAVSDRLTETNLELETFTQAITNDLQAQIETVKGASEKLIKDYNISDLDPEAETFLTIIQENATRIDQEINDLLELSKLGRQELNKVETDPNKIIKTVIKDFSQEIKNRNIIIDQEDLPECVADQELLKEVFHNLISNAVKFTLKQKEPRIKIGSQKSDQQSRVVYFVRDNGIGFDMKDTEKVFETFQRLHQADNVQGTGIGLVLAKRIISRHGGDIWVEAKEDQGATFYFDLEMVTNSGI